MQKHAASRFGRYNRGPGLWEADFRLLPGVVMVGEMTQPEYNFRWFRDGDDSEIPADILSDALRAAQRAFHLAGMIVEQPDRVGERLRARVPAEVARKYVLHCKPAIEGSYDVPTVLGFDELVDDPYLAQASTLFSAAVDAGSRDGAVDGLRGLPAGAVGRAFLLSVAGIAPPRGSGWSLEVSGGGSSRVLSETAHRRLEELARRLEDGPVIERGTVTGELRAIDFARRQITILHLAESRELECSYLVADEVILINQRLSLVHVTGRLIRDASGRIASIDEVDKIEIYDASPIEVGRIETTAGAIRPRQTLRFEPFQDTEADSQWMTVEYPALDLLVTASTRSALVDAIRDEIAFLWEQYVADVTGPLSASGRVLRDKLQSLFEGVADAAR